MSKWILIVIYEINIWLLITLPLRQVYPDPSGSVLSVGIAGVNLSNV